ncbi:hypothetical protein M0R45_030884 [Rubus argutus]|uniref:Uncharacterized protein n=1 Tax=Rubus argutus TaxID=59490 RepID=A0AAW1WCA2_RUBAR
MPVTAVPLLNPQPSQAAPPTTPHHRNHLTASPPSSSSSDAGDSFSTHRRSQTQLLSFAASERGPEPNQFSPPLPSPPSPDHCRRR